MNASTRATLIPGCANTLVSREYAEQHEQAGDTAPGHYSEFPRARIRLSSLGVGTFGGAARPEVDTKITAIVARALLSGINVIDTAAHYRYGRSLVAVGAGVRTALAEGVPREAMFLLSKGGFLTWRGGPPEHFNAWFEQEIAAQGFGEQADLGDNVHLLSPVYINYQLELSRRLIGVETLDAFLVDQPEIHIPRIGKEMTNRRLTGIFEVLERAVRENRLRYYGISTFEGARVETDNPLFQSITSMIGLAERAAHQVAGDKNAKHHFRLLMMPFNQVMTEGFTRFNTVTGQGNIASPVQAAYQLNVYVMASHTLFKGHLAQQSLDTAEMTLPYPANPAQRAMQFNRSTPGIGTTLVGMSTPEHLEDLLAVAGVPPMERKIYLSLYQRAD